MTSNDVFPKIWNGRTENKVQHLFLGKYFTEIRTALRNPLSPKSDQHQISPHHYQCIIIQQIVTMPIYGKEALNICHAT